MTQFITRQRPFPSFAEIRADLRLAELNILTPSSPASALVTTAPTQPSAPTSYVGSSSSRPPQAAGGNSSGNNRSTAADTVAVAVATVARLAVLPVAPSGPLSSTHGPGPFTCGPDHPLAAHVVPHLAPARRHSRRC
jgi:hypothetical protein